MTRLADDPSKAMAIGVGMCAISLFFSDCAPYKGLATNACLLRFAAFGGFLFGYVARPRFSAVSAFLQNNRGSTET